MTQAYNLSQLANKVNSSGLLDVATGINGTAPVVNGGTGQSSFTNGQVLIGNTTGNTLAKTTLTAGNGISITNGAGTITIATGGGLLRITRYQTAGSGTWTRPADTVSVLIRTIAGGGGGGGSDESAGGGGGGGGFAELYVASASSAYAYTVGAGGAGGAGGANNGVAGYATTIAGIAAGGGAAGIYDAGTASPGALPTGGTINIRGFPGKDTTGGGTYYGGGGGFVGNPGTAGILGGGGGGGVTGGAAGGAGGAGYIEITEYS